MGVNLHVDLETLQLIQGPGQRSAFASLRFKRGDSALLRVVFLENGITPVTIGNPSELEIQIGIKPRNQFDHAYLAQSSVWTMPVAGDETPTYECELSLNTLEINTALNIGSATADELPEITLMGEITFREGTGEPTSTRTFIVVVENDVNRGTEGIPIEANPAYPAPGNIEILANKGIANGYAPLNADGKVPATHITLTTGATGATGSTGATGAAGPNSVTTATSTNLTGFISGNGTTVSGATAESQSNIPNTLVQRNEQGGGVIFSGTSGTGATITSASSVGAVIMSGSDVGAKISSGSGMGAILMSGSNIGAVIASSSSTGAAISSGSGIHLNVGNGKLVVANNGDLSFVGGMTLKTNVGNNLLFRSSNLNLTGTNNTGFGASVMSNISSGSFNVGVGAASLQNLTTGNSNVALGMEALQNLTTVGQNSALGNGSLRFVTTGAGNTGIGFRAGHANVPGQQENLTQGKNNTLLGNSAGVSSPIRNQSIALGYRATTQSDGELAIGAASAAIKGGTTGAAYNSTSHGITHTVTAPANPSTPVGWLDARINGTLVKIPLYQ